MDLKKLNRDDRIVAGIALVLAVSLLFFPWFSLNVNLGTVTASASSSGTGSPDGWLGILALIATVAVIIDLAIERFSPETTVPMIRGSREMTRFVLALAAGAFIALKFVLHVHFTGIVKFSWGFYVNVVLVIALIVMTRRATEA